MASRKTWALGAAAIVVLAMFGSCNDDDSSDTATNTRATTTVAPKNRDVWVGTVTAYPNTYRFSPEIDVDLGNGHIETVKLAHIGEPVCGNYSASDARKASLHTRIQQLLPLGTPVTIVRGRESAGNNAKFTDEGFIFVDGTTPPISTTPTTTPSAETTATTPTTSPTTTTETTDTAGAPTASTTAGTSTATPTSTTAPHTPAEILVNEVLLSEGLAVPTDPDIDLSVLASKTVEGQMYGGPWPLEVEPNISYFDRLLTAHRTAWDSSVGFIADCRAEEARDILRRQQQDELDRIRRGPDGELGTSDDDHRRWKHDDNGNAYIDTSSISSGSSGSSGGGGGGGFCRSRWC